MNEPLSRGAKLAIAIALISVVLFFTLALYQVNQLSIEVDESMLATNYEYACEFQCTAPDNVTEYRYAFTVCKPALGNNVWNYKKCLIEQGVVFP